MAGVAGSDEILTLSGRESDAEAGQDGACQSMCRVTPPSSPQEVEPHHVGELGWYRVPDQPLVALSISVSEREEIREEL